jgi:hypothetical protein
MAPGKRQAHQHVSAEGLVEGRTEGGDEVMGQPLNEAHRVDKQHLVTLRHVCRTDACV